MTPVATDTIAAIATPSGNGGIGIIRISGPLTKQIAVTLSANHSLPPPRKAAYTRFLDKENQVIDIGLMIYFPKPASFTGEDCLELHGHGGNVVLNMLLQETLNIGARLARPGEFSERAFLNNKIDLAQAEAIADLIESSTEQAVRSAQHSLQGVFSQQINTMVSALIELRVYIEASIDFVDEEIDFISEGNIFNKIQNLLAQLRKILATAQQGRLLRDGMTIVLAGKPNAGKSSLLNALAGHDAAIVTDIAGTTRDILKERIQIDGMPLHIIDTAGLRQSTNAVEQEGVRRAYQEIERADKVLLLIDCKSPESESVLKTLPPNIDITKVYNKIDLMEIEPEIIESPHSTQIYLSVKTGAGMSLLTEHLKQSVGFKNFGENIFIARKRHIEALNQAYKSLENALIQANQAASELLAEELRQAQTRLSEITGEFTSEDLLGEIFSSFCIGK